MRTQAASRHLCKRMPSACRVERADPFTWSQAAPLAARAVRPGQQQAIAWELVLPDRSHVNASPAQVWAPASVL